MSMVHSPSAHTQSAMDGPVVSGHMPGPWTITGRHLLGTGVMGPDMGLSTTGPMATCWSGGEIGADRAEANARLMATAPDLMETLIRLADAIEPLVATPPIVGPVTQRVREELSNARNVVAKATTAPDSALGRDERPCANAPSNPASGELKAAGVAEHPLIREYRPSMDKDTLHDWAIDAVDFMRRLSSERERLREACRDAEDYLSATFGPALEYEEGGHTQRWSDDDARDVCERLTAALTQGESRQTGGQDIATAPRDLVVLMFEPHSQGGFMFAGCIGVDGSFRDNLQGVIQNPTHWQPLPAAPTPADGGGE